LTIEYQQYFETKTKYKPLQLSIEVGKPEKRKIEKSGKENKTK